VASICNGSGRDGPQQNDGLLVDEAQKPSGGDFYRGWMSGCSRVLISPVTWLNKAWWLPTVLDTMGAPYLIVFVWIGIEKWLNSREKVL
jgi:hypothetical protein